MDHLNYYVLSSQMHHHELPQKYGAPLHCYKRPSYIGTLTFYHTVDSTLLLTDSRLVPRNNCLLCRVGNLEYSAFL